MREPNRKIPADWRCGTCLGWGFHIRRENDSNEPYDCEACDGTGMIGGK